jgi:cytochrome c2
MRRGWVMAMAAALAAAAACGDHEDLGRDAVASRAAATGGDATRGRQLIRTSGCIGCHVVPGVRGADSWVGPPLTHMARRSYLAGRLPNTGDNMVRWLLDPPAVSPGTAMPPTGLDERGARDIAAYLFTLR